MALPFRVQPGIVLAASLLAACARTPGAHLGVTPGATLVVHLGVGRHLQALAPAAGWRLTLDGASLAKPYGADLPAGDDAVATGVPTGKHLLLELVRLDAAGKAVAGSTLGAVVDIEPAGAVATVDGATSVAERVAAAVLADDRKNARHALDALDAKALVALVTRAMADAAAPDPALVDPAAVAAAILANGGKLPTAPAAGWVQQPGRLVLRPQGWPAGVTLTASLDDPASHVVTVDGLRPVVIEPVPPGTWHLSWTAPAGRPAPAGVDVTIKAAATTTQAASFATPAAAAALAKPAVAGAYGVVTHAGKPSLLFLGGHDRSAGFLPFTRLQSDYFDGTAWSKGADLAAPLAEAGGVAVGSKLYLFGGLGDTFATLYGAGTLFADSYSTATRVYDAASDAVTALPDLPDGLGRIFPATGAIGQTIYVAGGAVALGYGGGGATPEPSADPSTTPTPAPSASTLPSLANLAVSSDAFAFDVASGQYVASPPPPMPMARVGPAGAVVGQRFYVLGGGTVGNFGQDVVNVNGGSVGLVIARPDVQILAPGATPRWLLGAPMPTARFGAGAVVVGGKIWVIGGATGRGLPSAAVEVYDPAGDSWEVHAPLKVARSQPAVGVINGKIVVAGGVLGLPNSLANGTDSFNALPVADVEVITP
jgi:hypothetical protein